MERGARGMREWFMEALAGEAALLHPTAEAAANPTALAVAETPVHAAISVQTMTTQALSQLVRMQVMEWGARGMLEWFMEAFAGEAVPLGTKYPRGQPQNSATCMVS